MASPCWSFAVVALSLVAAGCGEVSSGGDDAVVIDAAATTDACTPIRCVDVGAECGTIDDGCGASLACDPCGTGEACGAVADHQCDAPPAAKLRNGFVQSDGAKALSQTCDVLADGALDCSTDTHPISTFTLPPAGVILTPGVHISDRNVLIYRGGGGNRLLTGYLQSDGAREWVQTCAEPATGPLTCDPVTAPFTSVALPPTGLTLDSGTTIGGRYAVVYLVGGVPKVRNGYVQSDGRRSFSQDCDITATGALDCDATTHPFNSFAMPPTGITPAIGTFISDRYTYTYFVDGALRLRSGYIQSDGTQSWSQNCDISPAGVFDCEVIAHPFTAFPLPSGGVIPDAGTTLTHRYAFTYVE